MPGKRKRKGLIPLRTNEDFFDIFGYIDQQALDYAENSPTWQDLFGDDFVDALLDEDGADSTRSGEQTQ